MNEPHVFHSFYMMDDNGRADGSGSFLDSSVDKLQLLKATLVAVVYKHLFYGSNASSTSSSSGGVSTVVVKLPSFLSWILQDLVDVFEREGVDLPFEMRFLFAYRTPINSMKSWLKRIAMSQFDTQALGNRLPLVSWVRSRVSEYRVTVSWFARVEIP